jgi:hypothetical protein
MVLPQLDKIKCFSFFFKEREKILNVCFLSHQKFVEVLVGLDEAEGDDGEDVSGEAEQAEAEDPDSLDPELNCPDKLLWPIYRIL